MKNIFTALFLWAFLSSPAFSAEGLGRLFFTPEQRLQLDTARAQRDRRLPITTDTAATPAQALPQSPEVVIYHGMVRRSDGKSTVWLNGKPINEHNHLQPGHDVSVTGLRQDGTVSVAIPQAGRRASLKVGQSLEVMSGAIAESYSRRAALPHAPAMSAATPDPAAAVTAPAARPLRPSDRKEADAESGAAPAVRAAQK